VDVLVVPVNFFGKALLRIGFNSWGSLAIIADRKDDLALRLLDGGHDKLGRLDFERLAVEHLTCERAQELE